MIFSKCKPHVCKPSTHKFSSKKNIMMVNYCWVSWVCGSQTTLKLESCRNVKTQHVFGKTVLIEAPQEPICKIFPACNSNIQTLTLVFLLLNKSNNKIFNEIFDVIYIEITTYFGSGPNI